VTKGACSTMYPRKSNALHVAGILGALLLTGCSAYRSAGASSHSAQNRTGSSFCDELTEIVHLAETDFDSLKGEPTADSVPGYLAWRSTRTLAGKDARVAEYHFPEIVFVFYEGPEEQVAATTYERLAADLESCRVPGFSKSEQFLIAAEKVLGQLYLSDVAEREYRTQGREIQAAYVHVGANYRVLLAIRSYGNLPES